MKKPRGFLHVLLAGLLVLAQVAPGMAALQQVGPVLPDLDPDPNAWSAGYNGFPQWYRDTAGNVVALPNPPVGDGVNPPTMIFDPVITGNPNPVVNAFSAQTGWGAEAFYWIAVASIPLPSGGSADLEFGLEATYVSGLPIPGEQMVFGRTRIRIDAPSVGTYTVIHPFGQKSFNVTVVEPKNINDTNDIGAVPGVFTGALQAEFGPFLVQTNPAPAAGWLGDGNILGAPDAVGAVGAEARVGTPAGPVATFRVEGPNIGGPGVNFIETSRWTINARLFVDTPFTVRRATYSRDLAGATTAEVFPLTPANEGGAVTMTAALPGTAAVPLSRVGRVFFGTVSSPTFPNPAEVTVVAVTNGLNPTVITTPLVDVVNITEATYSLSTQTLTIAAECTDALATLTAAGWVGGGQAGQPLVGGVLTVTSLSTPPAALVVRSSGGSSCTIKPFIIP